MLHISRDKRVSLAFRILGNQFSPWSGDATLKIKLTERKKFSISKSGVGFPHTIISPNVQLHILVFIFCIKVLKFSTEVKLTLQTFKNKYFNYKFNLPTQNAMCQFKPMYRNAQNHSLNEMRNKQTQTQTRLDLIYYSLMRTNTNTQVAKFLL